MANIFSDMKHLSYSNVIFFIYGFLTFIVLVAFVYNSLRVRYDPKDRQHLHRQSFRYLCATCFLLMVGLAITIIGRALNERNVEFNRAITLVNNNLDRTNTSYENLQKATISKLDLATIALRRSDNILENQHALVLAQTSLYELKYTEYTNTAPPVESIKKYFEQQHPRIFNTSGWQRVVQNVFGAIYEIELAFTSPAFSSNEPFDNCDCTINRCGLPELDPNLHSPNLSHEKLDDVLYIVVGRHDARALPNNDNGLLAKRRAMCVGNIYDLPLNHTVFVGAPYRQLTNTGNVEKDRQVDVFVLKK